jgi:hypothetical protein
MMTPQLLLPLVLAMMMMRTKTTMVAAAVLKVGTGRAPSSCRSTAAW